MRCFKMVMAVGALASGSVLAAGAHVHGEAELDVVVDGDAMLIELAGPAANFVGFEHAPANPQQHAQVAQAEQRMRDAAGLFVLSPTQVCELEQMHLDSPFAQAGAEAHEEHGEHEQAHGHEHEREQGEEHEQAHSDYRLEYSFRCSGRPEAIELGLFAQFPALHKLEVRYITERGQGAAELQPQQPLLRLR